MILKINAFSHYLVFDCYIRLNSDGSGCMLTMIIYLSTHGIH